MSTPPPSGSPILVQPGSGELLTVGAGMEFATLADACRAAVAGDTIAVQAGTYVNDFAQVTSALRIVAVGGMVNEVATQPPPNDKALLTVDANLSLQGFTFTGGSDGSPDGNVSGIRLEAGNLNVNYCYFHDMQEGLLAGANPTANVVIDHSEFARNGTGDGYTHNLYVGAVASLTIRNSYFHDANVGHEIKSRAAVTSIANNVVADGPNGTASYCIDLPNAGVARILGNVIEKGPNAANHFAIHYGGELQFSYGTNSLLVSNNTILNDQGTNTYALLNQSAANGVTTQPVIHDNFLFGFPRPLIAYGGASLSNNAQLASEPAYSTASPWQAAPLLAVAAGPQHLTLSNSGHTVAGGATRLTAIDNYGGNTIAGGSGGLTMTSCGWDVISTQAGAADTITLTGRNDTVMSAGTDRINAPGYYHSIVATGQATISGGGFNLYTLNGAGEQLIASGSGIVHVGAGANANIMDNEGEYQFDVAAGGRAVLNDLAVTPTGGAASTATISGGAAAGWIGSGGSIALTTGDGGARVQAGTGLVSVMGGAGADTLVAGSGTALFTLGGGADRVAFGSGTASVMSGAGVDSYIFQQGMGGSDTISGFKPGQDTMQFYGFSGPAITSQAVANGSTVLTLTDGTVVTLANVVLPSGSGSASSAIRAGLGNATLSGGSTHASFGSVASAIDPGHMLPTVPDQLASADLFSQPTPEAGILGTAWLHGHETNHVPLIAHMQAL